MKITIIAVGKVKESFFREGIAEYTKRLSKYCKLEIIEVADEKTPDNASELMEEKIKEKEASKILKCMKQDAYTFILEIKGEKFDSIGFANKINQLGIEGKSHIQFIIGGSLGLHKSILKVGNQGISFSNMTFPHQLMRLILCEQIYRGYRIISNEPYHK